MSETEGCTPEKLFEGFSKMSPEDQVKVRAMLDIDATTDKAEPCCDLAAMMGMMKMMNGKAIDPGATCKEMMEKCHQTGCASPENIHKK
jgi:hypothetical protein